MDDDVRQAYLVVATLFVLACLGELLPSDAPVFAMSSIAILVASVIGALAWSALANRWHGNSGVKTPKLQGRRRGVRAALKRISYIQPWLSLKTEAVMRLLHDVVHAAIVRPLRTIAQRRELAELSDRQLHDVGIDLASAGRHKAVAVDRSALCRLLALSYG